MSADLYPDLTEWKCHCGQVHMKFSGPPNHRFLQCNCVDCHNRVRIANDKAGDPSRNTFAPNGGYDMVNYFASRISFKQGYENVGHFRAGTTKAGSEYGKFGTINLYAKCCGSLIMHVPSGHPTCCEVNAQHITGWVRSDNSPEEKSIGWVFGVPFEPQPKTSVIPKMPCNFETCNFFRATCCCGALCYEPCGYSRCAGRISFPCCPFSCFYEAKEAALDFLNLKPGDAEHNGKAIEYITDPKYLFPAAAIQPQIMKG
uniref:Uncharacterized protein n=1 Tax=Haptolina brevifila TaxID=156173 RepID=A0A7S2J3Y8_9EUKA|mmetsp:Transcript_75606/g.149937  ORF Transcript_75606/g.149937 Transcript_75606/m.149937 type:complete len:258 (+) Transcript_75606:20-793(+)|eukprot:CAMPEP_0174716428 /NCGR_PEP_ID=MMETSP1094-20130205/24127_1 /TAXON_ID=156173 /ORGANISM="Chrysochromulina brevifilum, Strain UTEX LB 985" /LENGTH=257 /DNA_ID=CAMNT_0015916179 /DNA_START=18 /DNA_END=791 /DNA_ORIENTATION=+